LARIGTSGSGDYVISRPFCNPDPAARSAVILPLFVASDECSAELRSVAASRTNPRTSKKSMHRSPAGLKCRDWSRLMQARPPIE